MVSLPYLSAILHCLSIRNTKNVFFVVLFSQVGCGAIGCEMLKNYAMIGIGTGPKGKVSIDLLDDIYIHNVYIKYQVPNR